MCPCRHKRCIGDCPPRAFESQERDQRSIQSTQVLVSATGGQAGRADDQRDPSALKTGLWGSPESPCRVVSEHTGYAPQSSGDICACRNSMHQRVVPADVFRQFVLKKTSKFEGIRVAHGPAESFCGIKQPPSQCSILMLYRCSWSCQRRFRRRGPF